MSKTDFYRSRRTLSYEEAEPILDDLVKQWAEEDKLEALQKKSKKNNSKI